MITAIIVAAGNSLRYSKDKMFLQMGAFCVIERAVLPFVNHEKVRDIIVVANANNYEKISNVIKGYMSIKPIKIIIGGESRTESVRLALNETHSKYVLIHDGARPNLSYELLTRVIDNISYGASIPVIPLKDSLRGQNGAQDRENFCLVQTPQGFDTQKLKTAYSQLGDRVYSDDSAVYESIYGKVATVQGEEDNIKLTHIVDYYGLQGRARAVGLGYDVHKLERGKKLILGGVEIPFDKGLVSHSDGDVLLHAIMDALLTTIKSVDIGSHFPDTDKQYKDISSAILLEKVLKIVKKEGYNIINLSAVIMAEAPKLSAYIPKIIQNIANLLQMDNSNIGLAATTTEGLGVIGKQKGMAAKVVVCLEKEAEK